MIPDGLDACLISKKTSQQTEQVTCIECCKYYIAPETATCGHTLCHGCWTGRRSCPVCASLFDRKVLRLNIPLQTLTEHVHALGEAYEKLFNMKLDEFTLEMAESNMVVGTDPNRNVKDWLASSQNHFSAPIINSQQSTQNIVNIEELSASKIQIHEPIKGKSIQKLVSPKQTESPSNFISTKSYQQADWDKIEILSNTEDNAVKYKGNVMDIDPFSINDNEYTTDHPRRSSRRRDQKTDSIVLTEDVLVSADKQSSKNSSSETEKRFSKSKQNWNNVKKMRKEFSKLNKRNKSKLNVSIEMCKKGQNANTKPAAVILQEDSQQPCYVIDDNTPNVVKDQEDKTVRPDKKFSDSCQIIENTEPCKVTSNIEDVGTDNNDAQNNTRITRNDTGISISNDEKEISGNENHSYNKTVQNKDTPYQKMPFIKRGILHQKSVEENCVKVTQSNITANADATNTDDIEISIKIGNTVTNITIKKKIENSTVKVNADREVQTTTSLVDVTVKNDASCSPIKLDKVQNKHLSLCCENNANKANKTTSTKKNTDSADTATAHFEITESVEKELSDLMECVESDTSKLNQGLTKANKTQGTIKKHTQNVNVIPENDLDIFNSGSVKEQNVHMLKNSDQAASEILPTLMPKKSQNANYKRNRDLTDDIEVSLNKKQKKVTDDAKKPINIQIPNSKEVGNISDNINYDTIMSQVFANIDADMNNQHKSGKLKQVEPSIQKSQNASIQKTKDSNLKAGNASQLKEIIDQKYSENVFSLLEKENDSLNLTKSNNVQVPGPRTQQNIEKLLTPGMCQDLESSAQDLNIQSNEIEMLPATPMENDNSDESVVEETPQKNLSFSKAKPKNDFPMKSSDKLQQSKINTDSQRVGTQLNDSQVAKSIINISDITQEFNKPRDVTVTEVIDKKRTLETPLTINKFVDHIKHNSTPVARKSLNFDSENIEDPELTLCPTNTQEKEFLTKAFEQTPKSPIKRPFALKNINDRGNKKFCLAGSCLTAAELANVKTLCHYRGWSYVDKYTSELTHLIVGVDNEKKSQRSVKYMCALAASKWIVTYAWVQTCLQMKNVADEAPHEALDACGEPGPRRSRLAQKKLFDGMKFYCMPPFSILDVNTLKQILEAAGGRVMKDVQGVKVTADGDGAPALLLAEPENTQEDRFIYIAIELSIVPVNYEWVLNSLGTYTLGSFYDLLLCPSTLLPPVTKTWPATLLRETEYDVNE